MQPVEAYSILDQATASLTVNRATHAAITTALQVVKRLIDTRDAQEKLLKQVDKKAEQASEQPTVQ